MGFCGEIRKKVKTIRQTRKFLKNYQIRQKNHHNRILAEDWRPLFREKNQILVRTLQKR